ncbi:hypothetical protein HYV50_01360 [Candidatus Pacearchaeota archaeon]|nr:hypothetical protein [Candidatus Pacearchaeota archaeon]
MVKENKKKSVLIFLIAFLILVFLGWVGYQQGFLGFIYNVMMPERLGAFPLIVLSMIFGIAAFFSPCALTVLPGYVAHFLTGGKLKKISRKKVFWKSLYLGGIGALGIFIVNMILGLIIALLGSATPFAKDPRQDIAIILGIRIVAGFLIAGLGVIILLGKTLPVTWVHRLFAQRAFTKSIFFYGVIYNGAAIGCTGPIMLGLLLYAFAATSFTGAITTFLVFSLTMSALMIILTLIAGLFKDSLIPYLLTASETIKKMAAIIMIIMGLAIALLTLQGNQLFVRLFFPHLS